jgi:hypothetical protein
MSSGIQLGATDINLNKLVPSSSLNISSARNPDHLRANGKKNLLFAWFVGKEIESSRGFLLRSKLIILGEEVDKWRSLININFRRLQESRRVWYVKLFILGKSWTSAALSCDIFHLGERVHNSANLRCSVRCKLSRISLSHPLPSRPNTISEITSSIPKFSYVQILRCYSLLSVEAVIC